MRPLPNGVTYFLDPQKGDDAVEGSQDRPWRTVSHGVRQLRAGQTLVLRGGVYYERVYLALAGQRDQAITIRSYPGEQAILDGSLREFTEQPKECWQPVEDAAPGEFVSRNAYPNLRDVVGSFGDSQIGLQTYYHAKDLQSTNSLVDRRSFAW